MILTGKEIERCVREGIIEIDPFDPKNLNPASYDLTLGDEVAFYYIPDVIEVRVEQRASRQRFNSETGVLIRPGRGYLMHTRERVKSAHHVPVLDGKSSVGRLFVSVHQTAGYGDPGFSGQYTLEVTTYYPVRLYAGMRIAQIRFHQVCGEVSPYEGNYVGEHAMGPVPSRAFRQFRK